ncbi:hypothetical protein HDU76_011017, partial [Blyttiomyces sp. JEL0837]
GIKSVVVAGPTGASACLFTNANTIHSVFGITVPKKKNEKPKLSSFTREQHERMEEVFGNKKPFGGRIVVLFGDNLQLQPVGGEALYKAIVDGSPIGILLRMFRRFVLTQLERSSSDPLLGNLIRRIADPHLSDPLGSEWDQAVTISSTRYAAQLATSDPSRTEAYNVMESEDQPTLFGYFVSGAKARLTHNVNVAAGLCNGTSVVLHRIQYPKGNTVNELIRNAGAGEMIDTEPPEIVHVLFKPSIEVLETAFRGFQRWGKDGTVIVPIRWAEPKTVKSVIVCSDEGGIVSTSIYEPPLALSYAMTYHVVQGATLEKAILDFNNYATFPTGLNINSGYVAITRAKELKSMR